VTYLVLGRKGGGKSALGMNVLKKRMMARGDYRPIVTNLPIRIHKLAAYMERRHLTITNRLYVRKYPQYSVEWLRKFWRDRGSHGMGLDTREVAEAGCKVPTLEFTLRKPVNEGTIYIIDEVAQAFRSRDWQNFQAEAEWYLRAEGHFNDEVWLLVQDEELIDVTFARLFNEVVRVHPNWRTRVAGFSAGNSFEVRYFNNLEDTSDAAMIKMEKIPVEKELLDCYKTRALSGSVSNSVRLEDKGRNPKLLWGLIAAVPLVVILFFWGLLHFGGRKLTSALITGEKMTRPVASAPVRAGLSTPSVLDGARVLMLRTPPHYEPPAPPPPLTNSLPPAPLPTSVVASVPPAPRAPRLLGWSVSAGRAMVRTDYGALQLEGVTAGLDALYFNGGRWRIGRTPEGVRIEF